MNAILDVSSLRVVQGAHTLIDGVSFRARQGIITGILGPNGAGKSSLVKAIVGLWPYEGEILLEGRDVRALDASARARSIAYVPQQSELSAPLTVAEVVQQGRHAHHAGRLRAGPGDHTAVEGAIASTGLEELADRPFTTLSQGERQRVLIARALATEARVLVLDEPTSALDVGHALRVCGLLRRLASAGYCVMVVLHALQEALDWTDEALALERGRIVTAGATRSVILDPRVESIYGVKFVPRGALGFRLPEVERPPGAPS